MLGLGKTGQTMVDLRKTRVSHFTAETVQPLASRIRPAVACVEIIVYWKERKKKMSSMIQEK